MSIADDLRLEEYKSLREEILAQQRRRDHFFQIGVTAIALIYAWTLSSDEDADAADAIALPVLAMILIVPPIIALVGALWQTAVTKGVKTAGRYLALMQEHGEAPGWERTLRHAKLHACDVEQAFLALTGVTAVGEHSVATPAEAKENRKKSEPNEVVAGLWWAALVGTSILSLAALYFKWSTT